MSGLGCVGSDGNRALSGVDGFRSHAGGDVKSSCPSLTPQPLYNLALSLSLIFPFFFLAKAGIIDLTRVLGQFY